MVLAILIIAMLIGLGLIVYGVKVLFPDEELSVTVGTILITLSIVAMACPVGNLYLYETDAAGNRSYLDANWGYQLTLSTERFIPLYREYEKLTQKNIHEFEYDIYQNKKFERKVKINIQIYHFPRVSNTREEEIVGLIESDKILIANSSGIESYIREELNKEEILNNITIADLLEQVEEKYNQDKTKGYFLSLTFKDIT